MIIGFFLGAFIHPIILTILTIFPACITFLGFIKQQKYFQALKISLIWTFTIVLIGIILTIIFPDLAAIGILNGTGYQSGMFNWIKTGVGSESNPSQFIPIHIRDFSIFCILSLISMSLVGLFFGAYLMNYMDFYVGMLFLNIAEPNIFNYLAISALGWHIWSITRVIGFIIAGTALSIPLTALLFKQKIPWKVIGKYMLISLALIIIDIILKAALAPIYQQIFNSIIAT